MRAGQTTGTVPRFGTAFAEPITPSSPLQLPLKLLVFNLPATWFVGSGFLFLLSAFCFVLLTSVLSYRKELNRCPIDAVALRRHSA